jgi:pimeloyl-ACP methyl ester carboxylesterase
VKYTKAKTDKFVKIHGADIHYNDTETKGVPVLFTFHGGGPGANAWDNTKHNIDWLGDRLRVIPMDLPAYGESDKKVRLAEGDTLDKYWAKMVIGLMDHLNIPKASFYVSSQSGATGLRLGLDYPDRTEKIIMQSSGVGGGMLTFSPTPPEGIKALGVFANNPVRENMVKMMQLFVPKAELLTEEMIEDRFQAAIRPGHLEARAALNAGRNADLSREIGKLKTPVLVVWGHQDRMVPVEGAFRALAQIPNVRIHVWGGGTGHFVEYEQADEFNRLVLDFLTH